MIGLIDSATVYTAAADTGAFTVEAKTSLACRLVQLPVTGATIDERAELAKRRILLWDAGYVMPDNAQLLVSGERWNVVQGTATAPRGPYGTVAYRRAEVVRAT